MIAPVAAGRWIVVVSWVLLLGSLGWRARARKATERRRDPLSLVGLALEGAAFFALYMSRDPARSLPAVAPPAVAWAVVALAAVLLAASIGLADRALTVLGAQWRVVASVAEGDRLVTDGPYAHLRHPVYSAMLGMLVGTGVLLAPPASVVVAAAVYAVGTAIRIRSEERLLRAKFGAAQEAYARAVPALLPRRGRGPGTRR